MLINRTYLPFCVNRLEELTVSSNLYITKVYLLLIILFAWLFVSLQIVSSSLPIFFIHFTNIIFETVCCQFTEQNTNRTQN